MTLCHPNCCKCNQLLSSVIFQGCGYCLYNNPSSKLYTSIKTHLNIVPLLHQISLYTMLPKIDYNDTTVQTILLCICPASQCNYIPLYFCFECTQTGKQMCVYPLCSNAFTLKCAHACAYICTYRCTHMLLMNASLSY